MRRLLSQEVQDLAYRAAVEAGFTEDVSQHLAEWTTEAEIHGNSPVGLSHLFNYFDGAEKGLLNVAPKIQQHSSASAMMVTNADDGPMQYAFVKQEADFVEATRTHGIAVLMVTDAFAAGELGYYARRLANHSIASINAVNSPAVMSFGGSKTPLLGTNPLCYGVPLSDEKVIIVDQASSNTALVNVQQSAQEGTALPEGWAVDVEGHMTTDPTAALAGALLPFGNYKGGNIAMLVELLALMGGAKTSFEAASFQRDKASPKVGGTFIGIDSQKLPGYAERVDTLLRVFEDHGSDIRLLRDVSNVVEHVDVPERTYQDITQFIAKREVRE